MKVSQRVSESEIQTVGSTLGRSQFTKGHNFVKTVNVVTVLNLCTSSDVLYTCIKFQENIYKAFRVIKRMGLRGCGLFTEIFQGA